MCQYWGGLLVPLNVHNARTIVQQLIDEYTIADKQSSIHPDKPV
jgi:hypothetical protein